jgi:hypothetical protein
MRYLQVLSLAASVCFSGLAFADPVKGYEGPAYPRCAGSDAEWPNRWGISFNENDEFEKDDFLKLFRVLGTAGFTVDGISNYGLPVTYIAIRFNTNYYSADPAKAERVLISGLESLASLKGFHINCSSIYRPMPALKTHLSLGACERFEQVVSFPPLQKVSRNGGQTPTLSFLPRSAENFREAAGVITLIVSKNTRTFEAL